MPKVSDIQPIQPPEQSKEKKVVPISGGDIAPQPVGVASAKPAPTPSAEDAFLAKLASKEKAVGGPVFFSEGDDPAGGTKKKFSRRRLFIVGGVVVFVLGGSWLSGFLLSKASVELVTEANYLPFSFELEFRKDVSLPDSARSLYPLEVLKLTATSTREYAATGEGEVKSKARGSIEIFNEFNAQSQTLVENTRFLSTDGKLFRLTKRTTVPEGKMVDGKLVAGSIVAEVVADQAGPDFNIQPGRFTVPGFQGSPRYSKFYGVSRESFKGGAIGRAKFVRADDVKTAEEDAVKRAFEELKTAISQSLPETVRLVEGALRIEVNRLNSSQKAGDAVDKFVVSVSAGITALVFDETHVREKAKELLPRDQAFFTPSLDVKYEVGDAGFSDGTLKVRAQGNADVAKSIDMAGLKQALLGKKEAGVKREILRIPGIKEAKVRFWPFWARKMPTKLSRIEIVAK